MTYFRVLPKFDQRTLFKPSTSNKHIPNGRFLIRNELYTEKEMARYNVPAECVVPVECHPSDTYWMFGARFKAGAMSREDNI